VTGFPCTQRLLAIGRRLREQQGLGLIDLLIAMTVLNVGILAVFAGFSSAYVAMDRSANVSSASALSTAQLERFRALTFTAICLSNTYTGSTYTADKPDGTLVPTCTTTDPALVAVRAPVTGTDGKSYRVDTYVVWGCAKGTLSVATPYTTSAPGCVTGGVSQSRPIKLVRVVIRDNSATTRVFATAETSFDQGTGI
jgi:Tfp pilus assembly protein PilV